MVTQVQQKTKYQCDLVCIESIAKDQSLELTQDELIKRFPDDCSVGQTHNGADVTGSVPFDGQIPFDQLEKHPGLARLLKSSGIGCVDGVHKGTVGLVASRDAFEAGAAVLVIPHKNKAGKECHHCVRLVDFDDSSMVIVMDPSLMGGGYDVWDCEDLDTRDCEIVVVSSCREGQDGSK